MLDRVIKKVSKVQSLLYRQIKLAHHSSQLPQLLPQDQAIVDQLMEHSVAISSLAELNLPFTDRMLQTAEKYLSYMRSLISASDLVATEEETKDSRLPHIFTVTDLPEFYDWATQPRLLHMVENYIGVPVKFQGVHLRRDFANESPITTELWHRDLEDFRLVKIFVYLSDATEEYGPLEYIPKQEVSLLTHYRIQKAIRRNLKYRLGLTDDEMAQFVPQSKWKRCSVSAGSVVFADPIAVYHHGKSRQKERSTLFFVYSAADPLHPEYVSQYSDDTFARPAHLV